MMGMRHLGSILLLLALLWSGARGWTTDELELFDLVEEVNQNFYTLLGLTQETSSAEIRKAFRRLSLQLHPDKNDAEDAEIKFRQLVGVYEVLRDDERRARYNRLLVEGMPDWRMPVYYYRRMRKMGLGELSAFLFALITFGQYIVAWAAYWERKYMDEASKKKLKKSKKSPKPDPVDEFEIPRPSWMDTLPFQLFRLGRSIIESTPECISACREAIHDWMHPVIEEEPEPEPEPEKKAPKPKRRRVVEIPDFTGMETVSETMDGEAPRPAPAAAPPAMAGGLWTDDDLADLGRFMRKYPGGIPERWERIAEAMQRTVHEVTFMAKKVKDSLGSSPLDEEYTEEAPAPEEPEVPRKVKTRGGKTAPVSTSEENWSQIQQRALEVALQNYPKGVSERWDRIAKCVPEKTKDECIARYKHLVEQVKRKKEEQCPKPEEPSCPDAPAATS